MSGGKKRGFHDLCKKESSSPFCSFVCYFLCLFICFFVCSFVDLFLLFVRLLVCAANDSVRAENDSKQANKEVCVKHNWTI